MEKPRAYYAVVHYHEIALKGDNRPMFVGRLLDNLRTATRDLGGVRLLAPRGRILLQFETPPPGPLLRERLSAVFGIANYSPAYRSDTAPEAVESTIGALLEGQTFASFRMAARRGDKAYPINSMELNRRLGKFVQDRTGARVDLDAAELTIHVEVLRKEALVYFEKIKGAGGLPTGVSGRVVSLISGGIDSPVASYLMMKRGCRISFVHFHSHPLLSRTSQEKVADLVGHLTRHQYRSRLYLAPFAEIQRRIVLGAPPALRVVLYRRMMMRLAEEVASRERAGALITGDSLGQVASQTLENITVIQAAATRPVLRPLIGFDKEEITALARRIGTYETSIIPDQDCCRLFIPDHPAVKARRTDVERAERDLDIPGLVKLGAEAMETSEYEYPGIAAPRTIA